jgi:hypothetical protein
MYLIQLVIQNERVVLNYVVFHLAVSNVSFQRPMKIIIVEMG